MAHLAVLGLVLFISVGTGCTKVEKKEEEKDVVIRIGEHTITTDEYQDALRRLIPEGFHELSPEEMELIKKNLVNQMIEEHLILGEAERLGIDVREEEVAREVDLIKEGYEDGDFREVISSRYGDIERWRNEIRKKLLIKKTIDRIINSRVTVTEKEALEYYKKNIDEYQVPEQVRARMIVVKTEKEAKRIRKKLTRKNFAETAKKVSIGPEARDGGDLGFFGRGDMPEEFEKVVFKLPVGRISKIVKTPYGYHIFLVEEKKKGRKLSFEDAKKGIMERLRRERADLEFHRWMAFLKKRQNIVINEALL